MEVKKIKITCPTCKKVFYAQQPKAPGLYKLVCTNPACAKEIKLMMRAKELKLGQGNPAQQTVPQQSSLPKDAPKPRFLGKPVKTEKGIYFLKGSLSIGETVAYTCAECGKNVIFMPKNAGAQVIPCPSCATRTAFIAQVSAQPAPKDVPSSKTRRPDVLPDNVINNQKVELVWGSMFNRHSAQLEGGITWVGRNDPSNPSDVMIKDPTISAHSFYIEKDNVKGTCKLCVRRATNPVTVNGVECKEGNSVYLNFGDKIKAGETIMILTKSK